MCVCVFRHRLYACVTCVYVAGVYVTCVYVTCVHVTVCVYNHCRTEKRRETLVKSQCACFYCLSLCVLVTKNLCQKAGVFRLIDGVMMFIRRVVRVIMSIIMSIIMRVVRLNGRE